MPPRGSGRANLSAERSAAIILAQLPGVPTRGSLAARGLSTTGLLCGSWLTLQLRGCPELFIPNCARNNLSCVRRPSAGELIYVKVPPGKGCGFVQYVHRPCAEAALMQMQGQYVGKQPVRTPLRPRILRSRAKAKAPQPCTPARPPSLSRASLPGHASHNLAQTVCSQVRSVLHITLACMLARASP